MRGGAAVNIELFMGVALRTASGSAALGIIKQ